MKLLPVPVVMIALVTTFFAACGKSKESSPPASAVAAPSQPVPDPSPWPSPTQPNPTPVSSLESYCWSIGGQMDAGKTLCKVEYTVPYSYRGTGSFTLDFMVAPGDTLTLWTSGSPDLLLDSTVVQSNIPNTFTFKPSARGYLQLRGRFFKEWYNLYRVNLKRCYSSQTTLVACP